MYVASQIVDNGSTSVTLILDNAQAANAGSLYLRANNTYSGGTIVNAGTLVFDAQTPGITVLPAGGLTINNATVTMNQFQGQINSATAPVLNGGAVLNLLGVNTLAGLTFNDTGGTANPTVNVGSYLTLTGPINVTNINPATAPIIAQGQLDLGGQTLTLNIHSDVPQGLAITSDRPQRRDHQDGERYPDAGRRERLRRRREPAAGHA